MNKAVADEAAKKAATAATAAAAAVKAQKAENKKAKRTAETAKTAAKAAQKSNQREAAREKEAQRLTAVEAKAARKKIKREAAREKVTADADKVISKVSQCIKELADELIYTDAMRRRLEEVWDELQWQEQCHRVQVSRFGNPSNPVSPKAELSDACAEFCSLVLSQFDDLINLHTQLRALIRRADVKTEAIAILFLIRMIRMMSL